MSGESRQAVNIMMKLSMVKEIDALARGSRRSFAATVRILLESALQRLRKSEIDTETERLLAPVVK